MSLILGLGYLFFLTLAGEMSPVGGEMKLSNIVLKKGEIYRGSHTKAQELNKQTGKEHLRVQTKQCIPHAMFRQVNQWSEASPGTAQA
jgi:hypothetical protein